MWSDFTAEVAPVCREHRLSRICVARSKIYSVRLLSNTFFFYRSGCGKPDSTFPWMRMTTDINLGSSMKFLVAASIQTVAGNNTTGICNLQHTATTTTTPVVCWLLCASWPSSICAPPSVVVITQAKTTPHHRADSLPSNPNPLIISHRGSNALVNRDSGAGF